MKISYHKEDDMDFDPIRESRGVDCATASAMILLCALLTIWGVIEFINWIF